MQKDRLANYRAFFDALEVVHGVPGLDFSSTARQQRTVLEHA